MNREEFAGWVRKAARGIGAAGVTMVLTGAMALGPAATATLPAKSGDESSAASYHAVDRAAIENLQRWVTTGHEDWCTDARLVAAEEFKRMAPDFAEEGFELHAVEEDDAAAKRNAKKITYEWAPLDGRAVYRVTVERFDWLLPIAGKVDSIVWVPTVTGVQSRE